MRRSPLAARKVKLLLMEPGIEAPAPEAIELLDPRPEMICFRGQTLALVRHFFEISSQLGRISSLLGREFFRSRVSHHAIPSFEEQAVFARDVELCLERLSKDNMEIVTLVGFYDLSDEEVAAMIHSSRTYVRQWFAEAVDALSEIFLTAGLLHESNPDRRQRQAIDDGSPKDVVGSRRKPPQSVRMAETSRAVNAKPGRPPREREPQLA
jgi:hypothetical protein